MSRPNRYPLLLDLVDRPVLVVGGGAVAARRVEGLLAAAASVTIVSPTLCATLAALHREGSVRWIERRAEVEDVLDGSPEGRWALVHTATGDPQTDGAVAQAAARTGVWCVRADDAASSSAHVPATAVGPDGIQVAVSGGADPGRARAIRDRIAADLSTGALPLRRRRAGPSGGRVVLVGGGPGDPGLLTVKGRQWLSRADVVVTDRLAPTAALADLEPDVEVIDVGKTAGRHPIPQDAINEILVSRARQGLTVVRLKGGDPFVLGRGGEEALHCLAHGVPVEVVPGVTSAIAVPGLAGIPVTHRGITTSVVIASAHAGAGSVLQASRDAPEDATLVMLMALSTLAESAAGLVEGGRSPATPVAVISRGSTPQQRTVVATLADIADAVTDAALPSPALVVVGEVVSLRAALAATDSTTASVSTGASIPAVATGRSDGPPVDPGAGSSARPNAGLGG